MYVLYIVILKIIPCSITNRIKCCTKIQTGQVLFFNTMKTFMINNESYSHDKVILVLYKSFILKYFLFTIVMATIPIALQITTSTDEDNRTDSDTNLSAVDTEDELHMDISTWTPADRKKLQHMTEFHEEYQHVFGERASIQTIMKRRMSHMNPPMPKSVCEEEM